MTDSTEHQMGGESAEEPKLGFWGTIAYWILLIRAGGFTRDRRHTKGKRPPSRGISGPINHGEDGHPWLWLEVETVRGFHMMSRARQTSIKANFEATLKSFAGWGAGMLDIQVQALPYDLKAIDCSLQASVLGQPTGKVAKRHALSRRRSAEYIRQMNFKERRVFIGVRLSDRRSFFQVMLSQLMLWLGFSSLLANGNEDVIYEEQIQEVLGKFTDNHVNVRLLTGSETARVIQHCVYRGHAKLPELANDTGVIRSSGDLQRLTDSVARDHHHMVEIIQDGSSAYVSYLSVAKLPQEFETAWLFVGDMKREPVEVSARLRVKPNERTKAEVARTLQIIENALEHLISTKGNQQEIGRLKARKALALAAKQRLDTEEEEPTVEFNGCMVVSSDSVTELKKLRNNVMSTCARSGVILEIDEAYQPEIRRQTYPGARLIYKRYEQELFCNGVAQSMPYATTLIGNGGDLHGVVLGPEASPFLYSHRAVLTEKVDTKTGQVFIGPSGEGKTDAMVNRAIADAEANMAVIFDEGKGDTRILEGEHELLVDIMVMDLSHPEMMGFLNPLYLGDDRKESRDLTLSVFMKNMGSEAEIGWKPFVAEAIDNELDEHPHDPDMYRIVNQRLLGADSSDPDYHTKRAIGRTIKGVMDARHSEVIFAQGKPWQEVADKYVRRGQATFVVYGHLTPPEKEKPDSELSEQERLAYLVRDLTNVAYYKVAMNPNIPLAVYKDEIQIDKRMGGSVSSEHLSRIGRSKGSTINLGGQKLEDVPDGFWENASTYNFFRFTLRSSAVKAIELLNINVEPGSEEEKRLINLLLDVPGNGRNPYDVIVKTYDGEIGLVAFKQIYHGGRFVSNIQGVERRKQERTSMAANRLPFARRADTPEAAEEALLRLGVSPEVVGEPNGYRQVLEQWKDIVLHLKSDELVVVMDGQLKVMQGTQFQAPQLPLSLRGEEGAE